MITQIGWANGVQIGGDVDMRNNVLVGDLLQVSLDDGEVLDVKVENVVYHCLGPTMLKQCVYVTQP